MFQQDASLFFSALANLKTAQKTLSECKYSIDDIWKFDINVNKGFSENCKNWIGDSTKEIGNIINSLENIKNDLISKDSSFYYEYMQLAEQFTATKIDVSSLTDEELKIYNVQKDIVSREYNETLLHVLRDAYKNHELDEDLQLAYDIEQIKYEIYNIKDFLDKVYKENLDYDMHTYTTSYSSVYKKYNIKANYFNGRFKSSDAVFYYFELNKLLIELDSKLTDEEKNAIISEFNETREFEEDMMRCQLALQHYSTSHLDEFWYNSYSNRYVAAINKKIEYLNKKDNCPEKEILIQDLKAEKDNFENQVKKEAKLKFLNVKQRHADVDGNIFTSSEDYYDEVINLKKDLGIATASELSYLNMSSFEKGVNYVLTVDASILEGCHSVCEKIGDGAAFCVGGISGLFSDDLKNSIESVIKEDRSSQTYDGFVFAFNLNEEIAYGNAHVAGNFFGEAAGTVALQFLPGGTVVMVSAHGLKGIGDKGEEALQDGEEFYKALAYGVTSGTIEAVSSLVLYGKTKDGIKIAELVSPSGEAITTKFIVSGSKEYLKEGVSVIIDGDYDFDEATLSAIQSITTTAFNEFIVSPVVDKVTFKGKVSYKTLDPNTEKVPQFGDIVDDDTDKGLHLFLSSSKKIALIAHKKFVDSSAVNKVAKKIGSKFMSDIYDIGN